MEPTADSRFFQILKEVCQDTKGLNASVLGLVVRAAKSADPLDCREARLAIDGLDPTQRDEILQRVHRRMVTDVSAIWDAMPTAAKDQRPN